MAESPLFDTKEFTQKPKPEDEMFHLGIFKGQPRPDDNHDLVKHYVVELLLPHIHRWDQQERDEDELEELRKELLDVIDDSEDGYTMAKRLDDSFGWDVDSELVDIMDNLDFYQVRSAAVAAWIRDNGVIPKLAVGQAVKVKPERYKPAIHDGEVRDVDLKRGTYTIFIPALGHVREGCGTHGIVLPWGDLEAQQEVAGG